MSKIKRKSYTPEKKAEIVRRHLLDKMAISDVCELYGIQPSMFYTWQKQVVEGMSAIFARAQGGQRARKAEARELARKEEKIEVLQARIARKDEVIAIISEEHLTLKKTLGVI